MSSMQIISPMDSLNRMRPPQQHFLLRILKVFQETLFLASSNSYPGPAHIPLKLLVFRVCESNLAQYLLNETYYFHAGVVATFLKRILPQKNGSA